MKWFNHRFLALFTAIPIIFSLFGFITANANSNRHTVVNFITAADDVVTVNATAYDYYSGERHGVAYMQMTMLTFFNGPSENATASFDDNSICAIDQIATDENGNGTFYFGLDASWDSGSYSLCIGGDDIDKATVTGFYIPMPSANISIYPPSLNLTAGGAAGQLTAILKQPTESLKWSVYSGSAAQGTVTVDENGLITPVSAGNAVISATTDSGLSATCNVTVLTASPSPEAPSGDGSQANPYIISDAGNLAWAAQNNTDKSGFAGSYFSQNADITLSGEWQPIGDDTTAFGDDSYVPFNGTYDGNGHTVSGLSITKASKADNEGLFDYIGSSGTVKNLNVDANIYGNGLNFGAVAGINCGNIIGCHATGIIVGNRQGGMSYSGPGPGTGGLVGTNHGTISGCSASCPVSNFDAGGLVGNNYGTVNNCFASGNVTGTVAGGLVGWNVSGSISDCYASGNVSSDDFPGGFAGENDATMSNCYALGSVTSSGDNINVGGFVCCNNGTITNCFACGSVSGTGQNQGLGGFAGDNSKTISGCYFADYYGENGVYTNGGTVENCFIHTDSAFYKSAATYTDAINWNASSPWDFTDKWGINPGINNGYPYLLAFANLYPATDIPKPLHFTNTGHGIYAGDQRQRGVPAPGSYTYQSTYQNISGAQDTTCVIAVKSGAELLKTYTLSHTFAENETYTFSIPIDILDKYSALHVDCYLFDTLSKLRPLSVIVED